MISSLRGTVLSARGSLAVIDVHGVGYAVNVTPQHALEMRVGDETTVTTTLIVREDSLTLYGFPDEEQLEIFELLIAVTGVGPKSALGVLGAVGAATAEAEGETPAQRAWRAAEASTRTPVRTSRLTR